MLGFNRKLPRISPVKSKYASCSKKSKLSVSPTDSRKTKLDSNFDSYNETIELDEYQTAHDDMSLEPSRVQKSVSPYGDYDWSECATSVGNLDESHINSLPDSPIKKDSMWPKGNSWRIRTKPGTFIETVHERLETARIIPQVD